MSSLNSKIKEARWKTAKQLEDIFGAEADQMKTVLPRHTCQVCCSYKPYFWGWAAGLFLSSYSYLTIYTLEVWRRSHPSNDKVRQWLLTDDFGRLSVTNAKELKTSGATKLSQKQGEALMSSMDLSVEDDLGADLAEDFEDYDNQLQELNKNNMTLIIVISLQCIWLFATEYF